MIGCYLNFLENSVRKNKCGKEGLKIFFFLNVLFDFFLFLNVKNECSKIVQTTENFVFNGYLSH